MCMREKRMIDKGGDQLFCHFLWLFRLAKMPRLRIEAQGMRTLTDVGAGVEGACFSCGCMVVGI